MGNNHRIVTIVTAASKNICRGADLFRSGIITAPSSAIAVAAPSQDDPSLKKKNKNKASLLDGGKDMVMICVKGNPQPFAIGKSLLSSNTDNNNNNDNDNHKHQLYGYGTKGVGVEIWNTYGDDLWRTTKTTTTVATSTSRNRITDSHFA